MKLLFYKAHMAWPRESGHDVHTYNMMRSLEQLGAEVSLATGSESPPEATAGINYERLANLDVIPDATNQQAPLRRAEVRFQSYWGIPNSQLAAFAKVASELRPDAVVAAGLDALPFLASVSNSNRVWYAADEWVWHHLSQVRPTDRRTWPDLSAAMVKGLYERVYRSRIDRAWVVSSPDARAMRWFAGVKNVDILPNGVDAEFYSPTGSPGGAETAVFWGRLDFGPNIQALEWFCQDIWPGIRSARPKATFSVIGFKPTPRVQRLATLPGVELLPNVPDIRPVVSMSAVVVLPFVSGGGIKNKLLEAAAMGKPIVCTRRARTGLNGTPPLVVADNPAEWRDQLTRLWGDEDLRRRQGRLLREWVVREHSWIATARHALNCLEAARQ